MSKKKARKHTSNGERNQYRRDEDQSVDDGSNNELSRSRATTKEVKPSDHNDGQTDHAHKCLLMARERRFPEDYLYCTRPSDSHCSNRQIANTVQRSVFGRRAQPLRLLSKIV